MELDHAFEKMGGLLRVALDARGRASRLTLHGKRPPAKVGRRDGFGW